MDYQFLSSEVSFGLMKMNKNDKYDQIRENTIKYDINMSNQTWGAWSCGAEETHGFEAPEMHMLPRSAGYDQKAGPRPPGSTGIGKSEVSFQFGKCWNREKDWKGHVITWIIIYCIIYCIIILWYIMLLYIRSLDMEQLFGCSYLMLFAAWRPCWIWLNCICMGWTNIRQVNRLGSLGWLHEPGRPLGGRNLHGFPAVFGVSATRLSERDNFYIKYNKILATSSNIANIFLINTYRCEGSEMFWVNSFCTWRDFSKWCLEKLKALELITRQFFWESERTGEGSGQPLRIFEALGKAVNPTITLGIT